MNELVGVERIQRLPALVIRPATEIEEFRFITGELIPNLPFYQKEGYDPKLPNTPLMNQAIKEGLASVDMETLSHEFSSYYQQRIAGYQNGAKILDATLPQHWPMIIDKFRQLETAWGFKVYPNYEMWVTMFGPGGSYFPNYSAFTGQRTEQPGTTEPLDDTAIIISIIDKQGNTFSGPQRALRRLVHEGIHLGVDELIVKKFNLTHWEKERLVDLIGKQKFSDVVPDHPIQPDGDARIDPYVSKQRLLNLPQSIAEYVEANPRVK